MSRNKSNCFTGANATPLGPRNKAIGAKRSYPSEEISISPPRQKPVMSSNAAMGLAAAQAAAAKLAKRVGSYNNESSAPQPPPLPPQMPAPPSQPAPPPPSDEGRGRPRKKRSRWASANVRTDIPGIPTVMPANLTATQQRAYILQLQIEDINRKLKSGTLGIPPNPEDRSPSPEPIYGSDGKRLNTREYRTRKRLEEDRHKYIAEMQDLNPEYKAPSDYKPPMQRISERVMIPQDDNPLINFVGLLIGPRGNTLKRIEKESNCKIMIRGKGSVKEGKIGRKDGQPLPGEDEPLHALVSSASVENVQKAVKEIKKIIKEGIEQPEGQNDLRKLQLMELARLNGTLRDETMPREREWLRPENQNITNTTVCQKCGGRGHLEQDCKAPRPSMSLNQDGDMDNNGGRVDKAKMDSEYMSLMAELGEGPPSGGGGNMQNSSGPNNWPRQQSQGAQAPPWMSRGGGNRMGGPNNGGYNNNYNQGGYGGGNNINNNRSSWPQTNYNNGLFAENPNLAPGPNNGGGGYGGGQNNNYGNNGNSYGSGPGNNMPWQNNMGARPPMPFDSMAPPPPPPPSSNQPPLPDDNQDGPNKGMKNMGGGPGGYMGGNYGMWGPPGTMNQPPMPSGPGPMPPPPPSSGGSNNGSGMGYNNMMGMMGYGMQPPPPPPQN